jgi:hypothetical protein
MTQAADEIAVNFARRWTLAQRQAARELDAGEIDGPQRSSIR